MVNSDAAQEGRSTILKFAIWILLGLGILLLIIRLVEVPRTGYDFRQDYLAAQHLLSGSSIYSDFQPENNHPPFTPLLFIPFSLLPFGFAILFWSMLSILFYMLSAWIVLKELNITLPLEWKAALIGIGLAWYPFQGHIALGQLSLLIVVCLVSCWALLRRGNQYAAGCLLGFACLIKLFPAAIFLYLILRKRWRAVLSAVFVIAIGGVLTWAAVGTQDILHYFQVIAPKNASDYATFPVNVSLAGVISRLFVDGLWVRPVVSSPILSKLFITAVNLIIVLFLGRFIINARKRSIADDAAFGMTCIGMLLLSPITWAHIFPILILPLGILFKLLTEHRKQALQLITLIAVVLVSLPDVDIGYGLMQLYDPNRIPWYAGIILAIPTIGLLTISILLILANQPQQLITNEPG
jgi:alpha-1,2-mannosyltransferase